MVALSTCALVCLLSAAEDTLLLEFTADWCAACRAAEPTVQRLAADGYPIQRIEVDRDRAAAARYRVTSVPCFVLLVGGKEVDRVVGAASYARLVQMLERANLHAAADVTAAAADQPIVRSQSPAPSGGFGLPRPLAALAKGIGGRSDTAAAPAFEPGSSPSPVADERPPSATTPAVRPQQMEVDPRVVQQARRATVRLRIDDSAGHSVGTGTIIDTHGEEALVVTCGHVFRDSKGQGPISVDLFVDDQRRTVRGILISHDLDRDIGLVAIVPGVAVEPVRVAPAAHRFSRGETVFSLGCDKGADPSVRVSSITSIDRYAGAPNLEVAGMPVDGRSGGGLFSSGGYLIGLCNAADPQDQEGIFASLPVIHWELDKIGQRQIYDVLTPVLASSPPSPSRSPAATPMSMEMPAVNATLNTPLLPQQGQEGHDTEVICIVRSRSNPQGSERLLVLDRPSRELLDRLATESQSHGPSDLARTAPSALPTAQNALQPIPSRNPVIRAQSDR